MKAIGGYFELELPKGKSKYHHTATFKSGRSALFYILEQTQPSNVYIPFYTCDALLEPFKKAGIQYKFYEIDENLNPTQLPRLQKYEYFLYINYFDLKRDTVAALSEKYGHRLIVDCSQAFYLKGNNCIWLFNSVRKFFGVPDGAFLYAPEQHIISTPSEKNDTYITAHLIHRFNGNIRDGYKFFMENEKLCDVEQKGMSLFTEQLLSNINFDEVAEKRKQNFSILHQEFKVQNNFKIEESTDAVPMAYPLLLNKKIQHQQLWNKNLFVPVYWKDVANRQITGFGVEKGLVESLICLPVDHRYQESDMQHIINVIKSLC